MGRRVGTGMEKALNALARKIGVCGHFNLSIFTSGVQPLALGWVGEGWGVRGF
jgi:hypothetical protein